MPTLSFSVMVVAALVLVLTVGGLWLRSRKTAQASVSDFDLDNWQPRTTRPLTKAELAILAKIMTTVPECLVLPQVSLSRFLKAKSSLPYGPWFRHVGRRCVDFLICSPKGDVSGVVELIDNKKASTPPSRAAQRSPKSVRWHGRAGIGWRPLEPALALRGNPPLGLLGSFGFASSGRKESALTESRTAYLLT